MAGSTQRAKAVAVTPRRRLKGPVLEQAAPGWFRMIRVPVLSPFSEKKETLTIKRTADLS